MAKKLKENKKIILIVSAVLLLLSVAAITRLADVLGPDFSKHYQVELNLTDKDLNFVENKTETLEENAKVEKLEEGKYRVYFAKSYSEEQIRTNYEIKEPEKKEAPKPAKNSKTTPTPTPTLAPQVQAFEARPVVENNLGKKFGLMSLGLLLSFLIYSLISKSDLKRFEKITLSVILYLRTLFELMVIFGLIVGLAFTGIFDINNWVITLFVSLGFISLILKVVEYTYFAMFATSMPGHDTSEEYKNFVKSFTKYYLLLLTIATVLLVGLYITFELPYLLGIAIVSIAMLVFFAGFYLLGDILIEYSLNYLEKSKFIKKNRFLQR